MLSRELKDALGMPDGAPPPWLINMQVCSFNLNSAGLLLIMPLLLANLNRCIMFQRYGPPPSYPQLKIPGLNAPIPPGASFGYRPGEWGKPPVDEVCFLLKVGNLAFTLSRCTQGSFPKLLYCFLPTAWTSTLWRRFWCSAAGRT